jgi:methylated-DNA-[protein]-cysteine S-methyltransferase
MNFVRGKIWLRFCLFFDIIEMSLFREKVLFLVSKIKRGRVTTYKVIAGKFKSGPRAVGQAIGANPRPVVIPCHRVVMSDGSLGGYSGGIKKKIALLRREGIRIKGGKIVDFKKYFLKFKQVK